MITAANRGQIESTSEIALNLLKGNIIIPKSSFEHLKPCKDKLLHLKRKKPSLKQKKEVLYQKGGFCQLLPDSMHPLLLIYLASFSNETRTKDDVGSICYLLCWLTFIAKS